MSERSPAWEQFWEDAKAAPIETVAEQLGVTLRRVGPDLVGPCPLGCAKTDGFIVTPKKGIFLCRPSGETGDVIDMVVHAQGCSKVAALELITGRDRPDRKHEETDEERVAREERHRKIKEDAAVRAAQAEQEEAAKRRRDEEAVASVLRRAVPIEGTHAEAYFRARELRPAKGLTCDLKFVPDLDYWGFADAKTKVLTHLATLPAMAAIIRDVAGAVLGVHQTYFDAREPRKWFAPWEADVAPKDRRNQAKKIRKAGETIDGGMIRLGMIGDKLAMGEGIETTLSWHALGYGPEDVTLAAAISLGNLAGGWTGTLPHPTRTNPKSGKPTHYPNGIPDMDKPGVILPDHVAEVILLGDGDSERLATEGAVLTCARRYRAQGRVVSTHWAPPGMDWNDVERALRAEAERREQAA